MAIACFLTCTTGLAASRSYNGTFDDATHALFTALNLDSSILTTPPRHIQARMNEKLTKLLQMNHHAVTIEAYQPGNTLLITGTHAYNIGAKGAQIIRFHIQQPTPGKTHVSADYSDRWIGMWPPFVFWNPGPFLGRQILHLIWPPPQPE